MTNETMTVEQAIEKVLDWHHDEAAPYGMQRDVSSLIAAVRAECFAGQYKLISASTARIEELEKEVSAVRAYQRRLDDERWEKVIKNIVKKWKKDYIPYAQCCKWLNDMDNIIATAKEQDK